MSHAKSPERRRFLAQSAAVAGATVVAAAGCASHQTAPAVAPPPGPKGEPEPGAQKRQAALRAGKRPNVLFIFSDDHSHRTISAYGSKLNQTPNIDRIAKEGALFRQSFCGNSICQPSRATILTGVHSHANGMLKNGNPWRGDQPVFTRLMMEAGYQSVLFGKWHMRPDPSTEFDYWKILIENGMQGAYFNPKYRDAQGETKEHGYCDDITTEFCIDWLKTKRDKSKPFMMMCNFKAPHVRRVPPVRLMGKLKDKTFPEPATLHDDYSTRLPGAKTAWMEIQSLPEDLANIAPPKGEIDLSDKKFEYIARMTPEQRDAWHAAYDDQNAEYRKLKAEGKLEERRAKASYFYQRFIKDYLGCVAAIDENIGRILAYLEEAGLAEDTIVIYSSDQSYFTGEHGWAEKRWGYEEGMKMPFVMRWPGTIKSGQIIDQMIQNIDYAPTLLDAAGLPVPEHMHGRSLFPLVEDSAARGWRQSVYYHYYDYQAHNVPRHEAVRTKTHKLMSFYAAGGWELYDLVEDPHEVNNVYGKPQYAEVQAELTAELARLREQYQVPPNRNTW